MKFRWRRLGSLLLLLGLGWLVWLDVGDIVNGTDNWWTGVRLVVTVVAILLQAMYLTSDGWTEA